MAITTAQYFGAKPHSPEQAALAEDVLARANALVAEASLEGYEQLIDPDTGTQISGSKGGAGDGGFRLPTSTTGRTLSSHKEAKAVDVFDPTNHLDNWISRFDYNGAAGNTMLEKHGLYREAPGSTLGWCHLTTRPPGTKRRTFFPG